MALHTPIRWLSVALMLAPSPLVFAQESQPSAPATVSPAPVATGFFTEPRILTSVIDAADRRVGEDRGKDDGPYVELGNMITGAGWISAGPGYRLPVLSGRAVVDTSATVSSNLYWAAQARFEFRHLAHDHVSAGTQ